MDRPDPNAAALATPAQERLLGDAVMALATDAVFAVEPVSLRLVAANRAFTHIFGFAADEATTLTLHDLVTGNRAETDRRFELMKTTGELPAATLSYRCKDGAEVALETSAGASVVGGSTYFCFLARRRQVQTENTQRQSEQRLRTFVDAAFESLAITENGVIVDANARLAELMHAPLEDLVGRPVMDFVAPDARGSVASHLAMSGYQLYEHTALRADGTVFPVEVQAKTLEAEGRQIRVTALRDATARKNLEEQLRQAQRMESVGRLAGGIAHDFNNLLTVILSTVKFLSEVPRAQEDLQDLAQIEAAAERAAELTQHLLAFARRQIVKPMVIDLNELARNLDRMLRRLLGEDVTLVTNLASQLGCIRADPGRIEQVLMNLVVNARDAMETGGTLTIETANVHLDDAHAALHPDAAPGPHVMLSVGDTGSGMDESTMAHIFEPFFTTKSVAKGTGLGLATCYGIIRQCGGSIRVTSTLGKGTTFCVYMPRAEAPGTVIAPALPAVACDGTETVLVVEDDDLVRRVAVRTLRLKGYVVHEAGSPKQALEVFGELGGTMDLLVTDVVMTGMSGKELADRMQGTCSALRVIYTSGYAEDTIVHHGVVDAGVNFLAKPYLPEQLARRAREVLDQLPTTT